VEERIDSLYALKEPNDAFGHIQEIIIQNFSPKQDNHGEVPPPDFIDMLKIVAISSSYSARMNIQIPPNLNPDTYRFSSTRA
jgi:FO synthase